MSVDIFAASPVDEKAEGTPMVRRASDALEAMSGFAVGEEAEQNAPIVIREVGEVAAPLDRAQPVLTPGSTVRLDVVVRTRKIGHSFLAGRWMRSTCGSSSSAATPMGARCSGAARSTDDGRGPVEPGAHFYRSYQLDGHGNPIDKRNAWQSRSLLYVRLIPPGAADVAHYRVRIPKDVKGPLTFEARLHYRKFAHAYTQFAYAGQPRAGQPESAVGKAFDDREFSFDPANIPANVSGRIKDRIPDLPIITLATAKTTLQVGEGRRQRWRPVVEKQSRERWNDWASGCCCKAT